ncbi:MAG: T9SS type A sorting domain-containing protein [Chitinophagaceae bacterium]|nr:MAG: T9SS type A sorting domain-containing protein [Chitinophagaceae bacterium]
MGRHLNLHIPEPCHESWDAMRPKAGGRHCLSCQKTVVDFSGMSDRQLAEYFRNYSGGACGRLHGDQLERALTIPRKPFPGLRYFLTISIPAFLLSLKGSAQKDSTTVQIAQLEWSQTPIRMGMVIAPSRDSVKGRIVDDHGIPVPFATVTEKGSRRSVSADADGYFVMLHVQHPLTLVATAVGHDRAEWKSKKGEQAMITLKRNYNDDVMGGAIVVTYTKKPKKFISLFKTKPAQAPLPPSIHIYPNPVQSGNDLAIEGRNLAKGTYRLELYNLAGQLIQKGLSTCGSDKEQMKLSTSGVLPGNYIVRVVNEKSGKALSEQVVVR